MSKKRVSVPPKLEGKVVVLEPRLESWTRSDWKEIVEAEGARVDADVTAKTDFLVVSSWKPTPDTPRLRKAKKLNGKGASIAVVDHSSLGKHIAFVEDELLALIRGDRDDRKRIERLLRQEVLPKTTIEDADFRGLELSWFSFRGIHLVRPTFAKADLYYVGFSSIEEPDFGGATLVDIRIDGGHRCRFDGLVFGKSGFQSTAFENLTECSFRGTKLMQASFRGDLTDCEFASAEFEKATFCSVRAFGLKARKLKLVQASTYACNFQNADFTEADLTEANLQDDDFRNATLRKANLQDARLPRVKMSKADLRGANFRGASLSEANLRDARIAGADFTGANVFGCKFTKSDVASAVGLREALDAVPKAGPKLRELEALAKKAESLVVSFSIQLSLEDKVFVTLDAKYQAQYPDRHYERAGRQFWDRFKSFPDMYLDTATQWRQGEIVYRTMKTTIQPKKLMTPKNLERLVLEAVCESFRVAVPTDEEVKQQKKAHADALDARREALLSDLRGGRAGVARWNEQRSARGLIPHFRRSDLSGKSLRAAQFGYDEDWTESNFSRCNLGKASLCANFRKVDFSESKLDHASLSGRFREAIFENASMKKAHMTYSDFQGANLRGVDLTGADLSYADLRGADLSNASLDQAKFAGAKYDDQTKFPTGWKLADGLKWKGIGPAKLADADDFARFVRRLSGHVQRSRLTNALKMLQKDRFSLFSKADSDELVGIVKSQTDKDLVYSCRLSASGEFGCCTQNLKPCGGLRGAVCKHLLVLLIGLAKAEAIEPDAVRKWVAKTKRKKPTKDLEALSETFLEYKGVETGEVDWRPTETLPEDYYAF